MSIVKRRQTPPQYSDYRSYKRYLRVDFRYRCCYCSIHESNWGTQSQFAVEHFRPKSKFPSLKTTYSNLYYACSGCNAYKGEKWPTNEDQAAGRRFFDPCRDFSRNHFRDFGSGELITLSPCGAYSVASLRLNRPMLVQMRNRRREYIGKTRRLLKEIRFFKSARVRADPNTGSIIDQLIATSEQYLAEVRSKYYRPPTP